MRTLLPLLLLASACAAPAGPAVAVPSGKGTRFARFEAGGKTLVGVLEGDRLRVVEGDLLGGAWTKSAVTHALSEVRLLAPTAPSKVLALAGNFRSHLGVTPEPKNPELFFKSPTSIVPHGADIVIPKGTADVHYEGELVVVIGKRAKNVSQADAMKHVFGVTAGNDVSARDWQKGDRQWWRAKGCDTFGPVGPFIVTGVNYDDLALELRLNGQSMQKQRTSDHIHQIAQTVSFVSEHVTLEPGDLIFMGTPGKTTAIKPGDVVEVELEGVGVLRNKVVAAP